MTDKERIRAEIKRLENETNHEPFTDETFGKRLICERLSSFIDSLPDTHSVKTTKLSVFNTNTKMQFDVDTPRFLKEASEGCKNGVYAVCWNIFKILLAMVAERATELNDPIMNTLMLRLNLYEVPAEDRTKLIEQMKVEYEQASATNQGRD